MTRRNFLLTVLGIGAIAKAFNTKSKHPNIIIHTLGDGGLIQWTIIRSGGQIKYFKNGNPVESVDIPFTTYSNWNTGDMYFKYRGAIGFDN